MPFEKSGSPYWYTKRTLPGVGELYKSLKTKNKSRARTLEGMLDTLHRRSRLYLLRALKAGEVSVHRLAEAFETGRLDDLKAELQRGPIPTLGEAVDAALDAKAGEVAESTHNRYSASLDHLKRLKGADTPLSAVLTDQAVSSFKSSRKEEGAATGTINNDLTALSALATWAVKAGHVDEKPEINKYDPNERIRYLDPPEIRSYLDALRPAFRPLMRTLIGTGMRLGEAESLRVADLKLNGEDNRAHVREAKTAGSKGHVFLPSWVADTIREEIERRDLSARDQLFEIPRRTVQKEHDDACGSAEILDYRIHDHRHTAAVLLARAGMPMPRIRDQLGHSTLRQTMKYAEFHPDYSDVGEYFERVEANLELEN